MERPKLLEFMELIPAHHRAKCLKMLADHEDRFSAAPGSLKKHQAWPGGYLDHLEETMAFAGMLYLAMHQKRHLPFSLGAVILILFLHDLEKPFAYVEPKVHFPDYASEKKFVEKMLDDYGIELSRNERNALNYIHGEGVDYHPTERIMGPLAAFCHMCDVASARIWYDHPKK